MTHFVVMRGGGMQGYTLCDLQVERCFSSFSDFKGHLRIRGRPDDWLVNLSDPISKVAPTVYSKVDCPGCRAEFVGITIGKIQGQEDT